MFERIYEKVDKIKELRKIAESMDVGLSAKEVALQLDGYLKLCERSFSAEARQGADELIKSAKESGVFYYLYSFQENTADEPEKATETEAALYENPDINFLANIRGIVERLKQFNRVVRQYQKNPKKMFAVVRKLVPEFSQEDVTNVKYRAFTVEISCSVETLGSGLGGLHLDGLPINLINDEIYEPAYPARHEFIHTLFDGRITNIAGIEPSEILSKILLKTKSNEDLSETCSKIRIPELLRAVNDELLAELETAENKNFQLTEYTSYGVPNTAFQNITGSTATAGEEMKDIARQLSKFRKQPELKETFEAKSTAFETACVHMILEIKAALQIAKRIGGEATEEVHAMLVFLDPTHYKSIKTILKHRYPKSPVLESHASNILANTFDPDPVLLKTCLDQLRNFRGKLNSDDAQEINAAEYRYDGWDGKDDEGEIAELLNQYGYHDAPAVEQLKYLAHLGEAESLMRKHAPDAHLPLKSEIRWNILVFNGLTVKPDIKQAVAELTETELEYLKDEVLDQLYLDLEISDKQTTEELTREMQENDDMVWVEAFGLQEELQELVAEEAGKRKQAA